MVDVCGFHRDQGFSYQLGPGQRITIGQLSNDFDSMHTLRYGGTYPGTSEVNCIDVPENLNVTFTNLGATSMPVYFVIDGHDSGAFEIAWEIEDVIEIRQEGW